MIQPYKIAQRINQSKSFQNTLFANYIDYSNGLTLNEYAEQERKLLAMGNYGVEDFHEKVNEYLKFLDMIILSNVIK